MESKSNNRQVIFCFGSNLRGAHGKGAALYALQEHGAEYGVGKGRTGDAYAIPTKSEQLVTLPLFTISVHVEEFLQYAREHPELDFQVTRVGCGLAWYSDSQIAPMFAKAPGNCWLPKEWEVYRRNIV
jgi:hypothetical protein